MTEEEARLFLALEAVRARFDVNADDWRYSLLRTFREYLRAIGVERRLIDPVEVMVLETGDRIKLERRRAQGQAGTPAPSGRVFALAYAAAAVTALRAEQVRAREALKLVSGASRIDDKELKRFRDNLSRGGNRAPAAARSVYDAALAEMRERRYGAADILTAVSGTRKFVG
jgi:hypothetical protein